MSSAPRARKIALVSLTFLIALCFLWEQKIAPLRSGGSWLTLKALPLFLPYPGILKGKIRGFQYASILVLLYLAEGVMRLTDRFYLSRFCAAFEIILSLVFFVSCMIFIRKSRS